MFVLKGYLCIKYILRKIYNIKCLKIIVRGGVGGGVLGRISINNLKEMLVVVFVLCICCYYRNVFGKIIKLIVWIILEGDLIISYEWVLFYNFKEYIFFNYII